MKPVVIHLVETYLARSEVFIHNYVTSHVGWEPTVLCEFSAHEDELPFQRRVVVTGPKSKRQPAWWSNEAARWLTGRSVWQRRAARALAPLRPAVLHAHFGQMGWAGLPVARQLGIPLVTTFYGYDMSVLPRQARWQRRLRELFQGGDLFLAEGPCMQRRLVELGCAAEKVKVQRIAIHTDRYPRWQPTQNGRSVVLFVGRFAEKKGLLDALAAVLEVVRRGQAVRFRVVGDGALRPQAEAFVAANNLSSHVEFLGMLPHEQVLRELAAADVFIHPSRTASNGDTEGGAPTIVLEAQAVGVPLVTTEHADIPNVAPAGPGVYLSPEGQVAPLAENLSRALRERVGASAEFVRAHHDVSREVLGLEARYAALADPARAPGTGT